MIVETGNSLYSDTMDALNPEKAGSYNMLRGTVETGVKILGVPENYQGIVTDVGYLWAGTKLVDMGKWEDVGSTLNNFKDTGVNSRI